MKLPGWCEKCRRTRQVRVSNAGLAMLGVSKIATGICDQCQDEEDERRRSRDGRRR